MSLAADNNFFDGYAEMLENLSTDTKLDLIARLSASVKKDIDKMYESSGHEQDGLEINEPPTSFNFKHGSSSNNKLESILLNGPVATEEQIALMDENRQAINRWRG